jgi:hypothetical protein
MAIVMCVEVQCQSANYDYCSEDDSAIHTVILDVPQRTLGDPKGSLWKLAGGENHRFLTVVKSTSPGRGVGLNITFIEFHAAAAQQFQIFFAKRASAMMLCLLLDVTMNQVALRWGYGKAP